jgi:hypothetical protein
MKLLYIFKLCFFLLVFCLLSCNHESSKKELYSPEVLKLCDAPYWIADSFFLISDQNNALSKKMKEKLFNEKNCVKFKKDGNIRVISFKNNSLEIISRKIGKYAVDDNSITRNLYSGVDSVELKTRIDTLTNEYFIEVLEEQIGIKYKRGSESKIKDFFEESNFSNFKEENNKSIIKYNKWKLVAVGSNSQPLRKFNNDIKNIIINNELGNFPESIYFSDNKLVCKPIDVNKYYNSRHDFRINLKSLFLDIDKEFKNFEYELQYIGLDDKLNQAYTLDIILAKNGNKIIFVYESF